MKSTDINRRNREINRGLKKEKQLQRKMGKGSNKSIGDYIKSLSSSFFFDATKIYNLDDEIVSEKIKEIKTEIPEDQWQIIFRKAVRSTKINQREEAIAKLMELAAVNES